MLILGLLMKDQRVRPEDLGDLADAYRPVDMRDWESWPSETLLSRLRETDVVVTSHRSPRLPPELAEDLGRLKYVCHVAGSVRPIVSKAHLEAGLVVTNWGNEVWNIAEGALAMLLAQLKQLPALSAVARGQAHGCVYQEYRPTLRGRDVGLYGFGPIGRHMADLLRPFGARIAVYDPYAADLSDDVRRCTTLRELFATCQIVSLHCGLTDETRGSVTRELLELLPQGGILVNTARGGIVNEEALALLVEQGRILAALDVICDEGNWPGSPPAKHPWTILTCHRVGAGAGSYFAPNRPRGYRYYTRGRVPAFVLENLRRFAAGEPLKHVVTAEMYDLKT